MGLFDGRSSSYNDSRRPSTQHGSSRPHSPARSTASTSRGGYYTRPSASRTASYGGGSSRGWWGGGSNTGGGGSSYYRRSPRQGYINYLMNKLQRMLRDLWAYARRHPMKAFFAVVVPLLSAGGAIHGLMRQFGVRSPMDAMGGGGYYGSSGYGGSRDLGGGGMGGLMNNAGSLMQIAKAFM